jgi:integrase/recombinase XerD
MPLDLVKRPGSRNWYVRGTGNDGRPIFETTKTDNEEAARAILVKAQARLLTEVVHGKAATTTFREAATSYIEAGGEAQYLFRETASGEPRGLIPYFGDKLLSKITQDDLDAAAKALCEPSASRETLIRNVYTPFIAVWRYAAAAGRKWAEPRQWERPKKKKGTAQRGEPSRSGTRPVSYERAWQFVSVMSPAPAILMTVFFYSGVRPIEAYALDCDQIDVSGRWFVLLNTKTGEARGVPMHEVLVPLFTALKSRGGRAFRNRHGEPYPLTDDDTHGQLSSAIRGARKRLREAGTPIGDVSTYTGRHTVSTQLVVNGVHPHIKDQILGHAADDMSRHYTHVPQQPLIDAINTLPVIDAWRDAPWMRDPVGLGGKLFSPATGGQEGRIIQLRDDGMTLREIGRETGVSQASVFSVLRAAGLTGTNAARGRKREKPESLPAELRRLA